MNVIQPTHQCFDDAVELLLVIAKAGEPTDGIFVVHALIESNEPGREGEIISHGWLEYRDHVFFRGLLRGETIDLAAPRREYYKETKVKELIRYTLWEVAENNQRYNTTGPWCEQFIRHTRQGKLKYEQQQAHNT